MDNTQPTYKQPEKVAEKFFIPDKDGNNVVMIKNHPDEQWQWVSGILSHSSSYNRGWEATKLIGPPRNYPSYGDIRGAWAAARSSGTLEFLELEYEHHFYITGVDIFETYNPGHVCTISARNKNNWVSLWSAEVPPPDQRPPEQSRIFSPKLEIVPFRTNTIRLDLDCTSARSWSEIDCVLMRGVAEFSWSPENNHLFPHSFHESIFTLLCINWREKFFMKDTMMEIIRLVAVDWPWTKEDVEKRKKKFLVNSLPENPENPENPEKKEENILILGQFGCTREEAVELLKMCDNNMEMALQILTE